MSLPFALSVTTPCTAPPYSLPQRRLGPLIAVNIAYSSGHVGLRTQGQLTAPSLQTSILGPALLALAICVLLPIP
ncbi:unnamed protein product [Periconia digitata]|uniref:Uncharacterized protein n=1 Tax=Periconia digitata TaxID=1303443 RepID=A0A9W4UL37_9PLEO|nr:unnamed protein product [Periconia digitata]